MTPAEIKQYLNKPVRYKSDKSGVDALYELSGAIYRKDKKTGYFYYQAELQSMNGSRSVTICKLDDISPAETTNGGIS